VDPPDDGPPPKLPIAGISIYTSMFTAGIPFQVANMPEQWKRKTPGSEFGTHQQQNGGRHNRGEPDKRRLNNPFAPAETAEELVNPSPPQAFAASRELETLKKARPHLTLTRICREAGISRGPSGLNRSGWPNNVCLNYVCMGKCRRRKCALEHPTKVEEATARAIYQQLEPGIKRLIELSKQQQDS
jgi:hypothetical protein